jgi:nicotinamidase-related amidase
MPHRDGEEQEDLLRARWSTACLLTIDVQRDFTLPSSPSHIQGTFEAVPRMVAVADAFRNANRPIVHAVRLYHPDGSNAERSRRASLRAGMQLVAPGSPGAELVDDLKPDIDISLDAPSLLGGTLQHIGEMEWIMYKPRWGAFFDTRLAQHLTDCAADSLVVCGCNFPNCPRTTIYEASERDFRIVLVRDAVSGIYDRGLDEMRAIGVGLLNAADVTRSIESVAALSRRENQHAG